MIVGVGGRKFAAVKLQCGVKRKCDSGLQYLFPRPLTDLKTINKFRLVATRRLD
jgi:hypothetical protein